MLIRPYERRDAEAIVALFHETIHTIAAADYTREQLDAWAPEIPDPTVWHGRMAPRLTLVAEEGGEILAFAELIEDGTLDMFYCRHDAQAQGIGSRLFSKIENAARGLGLKRMVAQASITARPFFERQGFRVVRQNSIVRGEVELINFTMEKRLE